VELLTKIGKNKTNNNTKNTKNKNNNKNNKNDNNNKSIEVGSNKPTTNN